MHSVHFVRAERLSFCFSDSISILEDTTFALSEGWTGLVGANGAGKSTLLRLIAGQVRPTDGVLVLEPTGMRVLVCRQDVDELDEAVEELSLSSDKLAYRLRGELRLDPRDIERWATLSPGERKRWQVGAALAQSPDVLLLDEPTNHLDATAREWVLEALRRYRGIGVVVSHDREVLRAITTRTLRVHGGAARLFSGSYDEARATWETEQRSAIETRQRTQTRIRRVEARLHDARRAQQAASLDRSAGRRMKDKNDSDARGILARGKADRGDVAHGRSATLIRRELERTEATLDTVSIEKELGRSVFARWEPCPSPVLSVRERAPVTVGGRSLFNAPTLVFGRDDRIWISGANGEGKSTLLGEMLSSLRAPRRKILVLPQDSSEEDGLSAQRAVRSLPPDERGRVLSVVAALGVDPDRLLASARPSPGESRKLLLAMGLGQHAWGLVLDEPTNHLDLPSIERLESALVAYPGALMIVTHDETLGRRAARTRWHVADGELSISSI